MCKCCQLCLESWYWNCCEERFCWDEAIAEYDYKEWESEHGHERGVPGSQGLHNGGASLEESQGRPVTRQPVANNNNHLQYDYQDRHREVLVEVPILAPHLYQVFSKSMIFKDDPEFKKLELEDAIIENNNKPNDYKHGHIGKVVSFKDEVKRKKKEFEEDEEEEEEKGEEKPFSDFEIMFQDELYKIDEEEDEDKPKSPETPDEGIKMKHFEDKETPTPPKKIEDKVLQTVTPESIASAPDSIISPTRNIVLREDSTKSLTARIVDTKHLLPRTKSALHLPRSDSVKSFTRNNSRQDLIRRVDSAKNIRSILARLPERSASFLSVPDLIDPDHPDKALSEEVFTISSLDLDAHPSGEYSLISRIPDTPVIKGALPKFFAETPDIPAYKAQISLQSIAKTPDVIFTEFDYSMPRYYRKSKNIARLAKEPGEHTSKSMPDLNEDVSHKVSKRLVKIRSRLKPLVIKKHDGEHTKNSHQESHKF